MTQITKYYMNGITIIPKLIIIALYFNYIWNCNNYECTFIELDIILLNADFESQIAVSTSANSPTGARRS